GDTMRKKRLAPRRLASQPVAGMMTALAAKYEVRTQDTSSRPAESDPCRCGRTTLVTLVSRTCMKATTMTDKVMAHFCVEETCPSAPGGVTFVTSPVRFALNVQGRRPVRLLHSRGAGETLA